METIGTGRGIDRPHHGIGIGTTHSQTPKPIIKALNDAIPDSGSGVIDVPINLTSETSGKLTIESFQITYVMQTVNLDISIPEGEILHERITPYEVVTRHVIGEDATSMVSAELTLMTSSWRIGRPSRGSMATCSPIPTTLDSTSKWTRPRIRWRATAFSKFTGGFSSPVKCPIRKTFASHRLP